MRKILYRVKWVSHKTGDSGNGGWLDNYDLALEWVDWKNREYPGIKHTIQEAWVEEDEP